jgi:hypothetical protein
VFAKFYQIKFPGAPMQVIENSSASLIWAISGRWVLASGIFYLKRQYGVIPEIAIFKQLDEMLPEPRKVKQLNVHVANLS